MKSVLLYNLYPRTIWKKVTLDLLNQVPHDSIIIHVTMPLLSWFYYPFIVKFLKKIDKVDQIIFSANSKAKGETVGFEKFRKIKKLKQFDIITYIHSKGTSRKRKNTQPIADWTELMRYFVVERLDLCEQAFKNDYLLYGVNLNDNVISGSKYKGVEAPYIFEGNFVSFNNRILYDKFQATHCFPNYYGVERFWGNLCEIEKAKCIFYSKIDHYKNKYPSENYKNIKFSL